MTEGVDSQLKSPVIKIIGFGVLLGLILVIIFGPRQSDGMSRQIEVGDAEFAHVLSSWQKTWQRPPTREEIEKAIDGYVREEVLYREALFQGLDRNNSLVKRALITQMNLIAESQADPDAITEEDVEAYYALRSDQFISDSSYTFIQVYFSEEKRGESTRDDARKAIAQLNQQSAGANAPEELGDPIMLDQFYSNVSAGQVERQFGEDFIQQLKSLNTSEWGGPVRSAFGWHAVKVVNVQPGTLIPLNQVRSEIIRELEYDERQAAKEQFFTELMQQYDIIYKGEIKTVLNAE